MINPVYSTLLALSETERDSIFRITRGERLNIPLEMIEKDLWTCHVLDVLFNRPNADGKRLLFKGGTSLSKVYDVIQRFSEDVDITVFRNDMGFAGDRDPANAALSNNRRRRLVEDLIDETAQFIQEDLRHALQSNLHDCRIRIDPDDAEGMTLLVEYNSLYDAGDEAYVQPRIKIEGGARSALEPHSLQSVSPYIQSQLTDIDLTVSGITTIAAERTFLDKLLILHGWYCGYRDHGRLPKEGQRLSRHYYDVALMSATDIAGRAIDDADLFNNVIAHAQRLFRRGWMKLDEINTEGIKLVPQDKLRNSLKTDYNDMQEMLFGDIPSFDSLLDHIELLEKKLNESLLGETDSMEIQTDTVTKAPGHT